MPKIRIDVTTLIFLAAMFIFADRTATLMLVFCVLCHEGAHLLAAYLLKTSVDTVRFNFFGARIELSDTLCSYRTEFIISATGPLVNIVLGVLGIILGADPRNGFLPMFSLLNFALALVNLLPIDSLDGGRMMSSVFSHLFGSRTTSRLLELMSLATIMILWIISVFLWFSFEGNISLFVFCLYTFYAIIIKRGY